MERLIMRIPGEQSRSDHVGGPEKAESESVVASERVARVSVVICAYTDLRWKQTQEAVRSALAQRPAPAQVLLVVDHNPDLAARARRELSGVTVLDSDEP